MEADKFIPTRSLESSQRGSEVLDKDVIVEIGEADPSDLGSLEVPVQPLVGRRQLGLAVVFLLG